MKDVRHVIRIDDEALWRRIQDRAYFERVPTTELARRALLAYMADPTIAMELIRNNPDANYLSKRTIERRFAHMASKHLFKQEREEKIAEKRKKKGGGVEQAPPPVPVVPDPFGLGF